MKKDNIVFLLIQMMDYHIGCLKVLEGRGFNPIVVQYNKGLKHPKNSSFESKYNSDFKDHIELYNYLIPFNPKIVFIAGWRDKIYRKAVKSLKSKLDIPIVMGMDNQWKGSLRQYFARLVFPVYYKNTFSHAWVAGIRQYEFARKLGFKHSGILINVYSANISVFNDAYTKNKSLKDNTYPKNLLFVGRFAKVKGLRLLIDTFNSFSDVERNGWNLILVGSGDIEVKSTNTITNMGYMNHKDLSKLTQKCGFFCLPSNYEPWGVVVQEFAASGLPLLVSNSCGSSDQFVIDKYNGYIFKSNDKIELKSKLLSIFRLSNKELCLMSKRSYELSKTIKPEWWVAKLLSLV